MYIELQRLLLGLPEEYKQLIIADDNKELVRRAAVDLKIPQSDLVNTILRTHFNKAQR
jgi:hypothetical protein